MPENDNELINEQNEPAQGQGQEQGQGQSQEPEQNAQTAAQTFAIAKIMKDPLMGGRDVYDIHFGAGQLVNGKTLDRFTMPTGDPVKVEAIPGDQTYAMIESLNKRITALENKE